MNYFERMILFEKCFELQRQPINLRIPSVKNKRDQLTHQIMSQTEGKKYDACSQNRNISYST